MQYLFDFADGIGVRIEYVEMAHRGRDGEYDHARATVRLQPGLSTRLARSVLAHELGHAVHGDVGNTAKQERRADEWAAQKLITVERYREAEQLHDGHAPSMAQDLGVITRIVHAYQRVLRRVPELLAA